MSDRARREGWGDASTLSEAAVGGDRGHAGGGDLKQGEQREQASEQVIFHGWQENHDVAVAVMVSTAWSRGESACPRAATAVLPDGQYSEYSEYSQFSQYSQYGQDSHYSQYTQYSQYSEYSQYSKCSRYSQYSQYRYSQYSQRSCHMSAASLSPDCHVNATGLPRGCRVSATCLPHDCHVTATYDCHVNAT